MGFQELALLLLLILPLCSSRNVFYVTPTPDTPCPAEPCHTLAEYVDHAEEYFISSTTFSFLPGNHTLTESFSIKDVTDLTLTAYILSRPVPSKIICSQPASISFTNVSELWILSLGFISCGDGDSNAAVSLDSVNGSLIVLCEFQNNTQLGDGGGIAINNSNINLSSNSFLNNTAKRGSGMYIYNSAVSISLSQFTDNVGPSSYSSGYGGGVYVENSVVDFVLNSFLKNGGFLVLGSGVYVTLSSVNFDKNYFEGHDGNVVFLESSTTSFTLNNFTKNMGINPPGSSPYWSVIYVMNTLVNFTANFINDNQFTVGVLLEQSVADFANNNFANNSRLPRSITFTYGAAVQISNSSVTFTGDIFTGNNAFIGGAVGIIGYSTVSFFGSSFVNNTASGFGGAVEVLRGVVNFTECVFVGNNATYTGGSVDVLDPGSQITFTNCNFRSNFAASNGGALSLSGNAIISGNTTVEDNRALYGGGGITVLDSLFYEANLTVTGNFLCKGNTADYGGCLAVGAGTVNISGGSEFKHNSANVYGGGIYAAASDLNLEGQNISFTDNSALSGGALLLASDSYIHLQSSTVVEFVHNSARKTGGAIEVQQGNPADNCVNYYTYVLPVPLSFCFFTVACSYDDTRLYFKDNTAMEGGGDIYGGSINNCSINLCDRGRRYGYPVFNEITSPKTETLSISSLPLHVYGCNESSNSSRNVYPGATLRVSVIAKGQRNGTVSAVIKSDHTQGSVRINALQTAQSIPAECTSLMYTIFSLLTEDEVEFSLYAEGPCPQKQSYYFLHLKILECPPGFELSKVKQSCVCDSRLQPYTTTCYIDNGTVLRDGNFWVGYDNTSTSKGVILNSHCPFEYCVSEAIVLRVNDSDKQCGNNRVGLLCGKCRENFSVVFGSSRCQYCTSGNQLKLLFLFVFAGIALVLVLFTLKLTVTVGTINGLIFYANLVQVNSCIFYPPGTHNILTVFIAWLNLDLGVEACFYSGMDAYAKTWLQFVFPIYVLALVGIIILLSQMSTSKIARKVNKNATSVLATLTLLSYAKLLHTIIAAMSVTYLDYPNGSTVAVWLFDGNIGYLKEKHIPLFVTAIAFFVFLLFPYTLLLFLGQWLPTYSCLGKIKPFLDAYYTPYTSGHRYWTGLLLLARCSLFLSFVILGNVSISLLATSSIIIGLFTLTFLAGRVFKNPYIGALEGSFLLNLGILATTTYHINLTGGNQAAATFTSIGIAFVTFIGIVIYHIFLQIKDMNYARYSRPHSTKM